MVLFRVFLKDFPQLPLFPSVCILWHKPQFFVETLAICVIIEITTYAFPKKGYFLNQKELDR